MSKLETCNQTWAYALIPSTTGSKREGRYPQSLRGGEEKCWFFVYSSEFLKFFLPISITGRSSGGSDSAFRGTQGTPSAPLGYRQCVWKLPARAGESSSGEEKTTMNCQGWVFIEDDSWIVPQKGAKGKVGAKGSGQITDVKRRLKIGTPLW